MKSRFPSLDGLRGVAALVVAVHHGIISHDYALYSGLASDSRFSWDLALSGMPFFLPGSGDFAVCLFFVLSGFVLAHSFLRSSLGIVALGVKRYARLTIPIAATSLLAWAAAVATPGYPLPGADGAGRAAADLAAALRYCLVEAFYKTTVSGLHGPTYNGVLWTIPIEFQGSLVLIVLFAAAKTLASEDGRRRDLAGAACALLFALTWHTRLGLFGAGGTLYWLFTTGRLGSGQRRQFAAAAVFVVALFLGTMPESPERIGVYDSLIRLVGQTPESGTVEALRHPLSVAAGWPDRLPYRLSPIAFWHSVGAVLMLWSVFLWSTLRRVLDHRACQWLGRASFPLYLVHGTVYRTCGLAVFDAARGLGAGYGAASVAAVAVYLAVALAVAGLLARSLEKNAVRWSGELGQRVDARWTTGLGLLPKKSPATRE